VVGALAKEAMKLVAVLFAAPSMFQEPLAFRNDPIFGCGKRRLHRKSQGCGCKIEKRAAGRTDDSSSADAHATIPRIAGQVGIRRQTRALSA
jgi:hypothetical protein